MHIGIGFVILICCVLCTTGFSRSCSELFDSGCIENENSFRDIYRDSDYTKVIIKWRYQMFDRAGVADLI